MPWISLKPVLNLGIISFYKDRNNGQWFYQWGKNQIQRLFAKKKDSD